MEKEIKYSEALSELQQIVSQMESESIPVDELSEKVKRASFLIQYCKGMLHQSEQEVMLALQELENPSQDEEEEK